MQSITTAQKITNINTQSLKDYLQEIGKYKVLSSEEEQELGRQIKEGNAYARDKLIKANLKFVVTVAKHYQNRGLSLEDLIEEGNIGLCKAVDKWDEAKGFRFITLAVWWIRQTITKALTSKSRTIKVSQGISDAQFRAAVRSQEFFQKYDRDPTEEELANICDVSQKVMHSSLRANYKYTSLDLEIGDSNDSMLLIEVIPNKSAISPDSSFEQSDRSKVIADVLKNPMFSDIERQFIDDYYLSPEIHTLKELSIKYGIPMTRFRNMKDKLLKKLKVNFSNTLRELL